MLENGKFYAYFTMIKGENRMKTKKDNGYIENKIKLFMKYPPYARACTGREM